MPRRDGFDLGIGYDARADAVALCDVFGANDTGQIDMQLFLIDHQASAPSTNRSPFGSRFFTRMGIAASTRLERLLPPVAVEAGLLITSNTSAMFKSA